MPALVPTSAPSQFSAGDSVQWKITAADYPATSGYSLSYVLHNGASKVTIESGASGSDHLISLTPAETAAYVAGQYKYKAHAVKSGERWFVDEGIITILPDFTAETTVETRTTAEIELAAVDEAILAIINGRLSSYTTTSGTFTKQNLNDLRALRNELQAKVNREQGGGRAMITRHRFSIPR